MYELLTGFQSGSNNSFQIITTPFENVRNQSFEKLGLRRVAAARPRRVAPNPSTAMAMFSPRWKLARRVSPPTSNNISSQENAIVLHHLATETLLNTQSTRAAATDFNRDGLNNERKKIFSCSKAAKFKHSPPLYSPISSHVILFTAKCPNVFGTTRREPYSSFQKNITRTYTHTHIHPHTHTHI